MKKISVVVACYNEAESVSLCYQEICKAAQKCVGMNFEFLFVDDGSTDETLHIIKDLAHKDQRVRYLSFSRNFGKEAAMLAGLENAGGDLLVIMDADLQDPPQLLPKMLQYINEGYDMVATRRVTREGEPPIRSFFARVFYKIINKMSPVEMVDGARDYRMMTKQVAEAIISCHEYNRYSKGLWNFVGFKTKWMEYKNIERVAGETKWSFWKLLKYAIEGIVAFSTIPLTLSAVIGVILCVFSLIFIIIIMIRTLVFGDPVSGWPSLVCIITFIGGVQLFFLGIIGEYLAKTYQETKRRPIYIIREKSK